MNYASIRNKDIANGEGVRVSLFVSGCNFHCPGCFNPEAQDFNYGMPFTHDTKEQLLKMVAERTISGLSILGGDPLCQNIYGLMLLSRICRCVHRLGKSVWLWTGYRWEDVMNLDSRYSHQIDLLSHCDVVVDGPFRQEFADRKLVWKGSSNQRVIDVQASLRAGSVVTYQNG